MEKSFLNEYFISIVMPENILKIVADYTLMCNLTTVIMSLQQILI